MKTTFETDVLPLFEEKRETWLASARALALRLAADGREITIDDVRAHVPPPENADPRVMGAVFKRGAWQCVGYRRSTRPECHGRPVGVFKRRVLA